MTKGILQLDGKISIYFIIGLLIQSGGIIWYFAHLDARVSNTERTLEIRADKGLEIINQSAQNTSDISGLKVEVSGLKDAIKRIDDNIQVIANRIYDDKKGR